MMCETLVFNKLFDQYYHPMCPFIYPLIEVWLRNY